MITLSVSVVGGGIGDRDSGRGVEVVIRGIRGITDRASRTCGIHRRADSRARRKAAHGSFVRGCVIAASTSSERDAERAKPDRLHQTLLVAPQERRGSVKLNWSSLRDRAAASGVDPFVEEKAD